MAINIYYLATGFIKLLFHNHVKLAAAVFLGIFGFSGMAIYLAGIAYLAFRSIKKGTHLLALMTPESGQTSNETGNGSNIYSLPREDIVSMQLPQRRDDTEGLD